MENTKESPENIDKLKNRINELEILVKHYEQQLLSLMRRQFGVSSEKSDVDLRQMTLFAAQEVAAPPETEEITYSRKKRKGKREEDLSALPVERIDYELSEEERACPAFGETMRAIGTGTRRELKLIPATGVVLEHVTHTYAFRN